jgi:hypothetical protein
MFDEMGTSVPFSTLHIRGFLTWVVLLYFVTEFREKRKDASTIILHLVS